MRCGYWACVWQIVDYLQIMSGNVIYLLWALVVCDVALGLRKTIPCGHTLIYLAGPSIDFDRVRTLEKCAPGRRHERN